MTTSDEAKPTLTPAQLREIAVRAGVHPNTVARWMDGRARRESSRRIEAALHEMSKAESAPQEETNVSE